MRKSIIGAATLALLASTALVSAQQERTQPPAAKEQAPGGAGQAAPDKGGAQRDSGATQGEAKGAGDKGKSTAQEGRGERKGQADKSDTKQDRKGTAQKQSDQGKDRTAEPKDKAGSDKGKMAEPKDKAGSDKGKMAEPKDKAGTDKGKAAETKDKAGTDKGKAAETKDKAGTDKGKMAEPKDKAGDQQAKEGSDGARVNLTQNQRTEIREKLSRHSEARVTNVNFSINIGTRVPRDFRLHVIPTDIVAIVPAYRGYRYFIVEERVVIVHPTRYEIVEVIEVGGPRRGGAVTASLDLTPAQIELILRHVRMERRADVRIDLALGAEVPASVELIEFPAEVVTEVPAVRSYRYVVVDQRVAIVDPKGRDVIRVLER